MSANLKELKGCGLTLGRAVRPRGGKETEEWKRKEPQWQKQQ